MRRFTSVQPALAELCRQAAAVQTVAPLQAKGIAALSQQTHFNYDEFCEAVPTMDKKTYFADHDQVLRLLRTSEPRRIVPSAGGSALLSFRLDAGSDGEALRPLAETVFQQWRLRPAHTLFIQAYPAQIRLPDTLNVFEAGPRTDLVNLAIKELLPAYDSFVLICQPHFLRYLTQEKLLPTTIGAEAHFMIGGSLHPSTYPGFLSRHLGISSEQAQERLLSLYGVAELGLGIGIGLPHLNKNRAPSSPARFTLNARRFFLESVNGELVVTPLDFNPAQPLFRYRTGDLGEWDDDQTFSLRGRTPPKEGLLDPHEVEEFLYREEGEPFTGRYLISAGAIALETRPGQTPSPPQFGETKVVLTPSRTISMFSPAEPYVDLNRKTRIYG